MLGKQGSRVEVNEIFDDTGTQNRKHGKLCVERERAIGGAVENDMHII